MGNQLGGAVPTEARQSEVAAAMDRLSMACSNLADEANNFIDRVGAVLTPNGVNSGGSASTKEPETGCPLAEIISIHARQLEATYDKLYAARQRVEL